MSAMPETCSVAQCTVGVVSPGEMGTALAQALGERQIRVLTATAGRSAETERRARRAGLELVAGLDELGLRCGVLLSTVDPAAALDVARAVRARRTEAWKLHTFVDANSIAPRTMREIADVFAEAGVQVVDASIHGQAARLAEQATMYLSGAGAERVAELFRPCLRTRVLGDQPGQASLIKMCLGSMTKGLVALYLQAGCLADRQDSAEAFNEELRHFYPEISSFLRRSVPTYRQHARRRSEEMNELAETLSRVGLDDRLAWEVQTLFLDLADCESQSTPGDARSDGLTAFLGELSRKDFRSVRRPSTL